MAAQEEALAAQQQQMAMQQQLAMRNQQIMDAEMAAEQDLAAGEQLGNIFKKNPALAFSRNAGQFASAAQIMQPSNAMKAAIPSLAMKLPIEERTIFNQLLNDPEFSTNPFAAYDEAQRRSARARQHGELVKAGVPLSKIDTTRDYAPIEYEDLVRQHTQPKTGNDYLDKLVQQTWTDFDDQYDPPETLTDPMDIALDKAEKKARLREGILAKYGTVKPVAPADAATAQKITAPGAMGGAPAAIVPPAPTPPNLEAELSRVPVMEQAAWLEKRKEQEAEQGKINEAWTKAKSDLEEKLKKKFPDKPYPGTKTSPLEQLALQIAGPKTVMVDSDIINPETGAPVPMFIGTKVLSDLGLGGGKVAFEEPGKKRKTLGIFGSQSVAYEELLKDWAQRFLEQRGKYLPTSESPTGAEPTPEQSKALENIKAKIQGKTS
jgi:hypothetical protein